MKNVQQHLSFVELLLPIRLPEHQALQKTSPQKQQYAMFPVISTPVKKKLSILLWHLLHEW
jgi:hypothetical protein